MTDILLTVQTKYLNNIISELKQFPHTTGIWSDRLGCYQLDLIDGRLIFLIIYIKKSSENQEISSIKIMPHDGGLRSETIHKIIEFIQQFQVE